MFLIKFLLKLLLLPVNFLLLFIKVVIDTLMRLSQFALGLLLDFFIFAIIFEIWNKNWAGVIISLISGTGIVAITCIGVMISETCDSIREKIMML